MHNLKQVYDIHFYCRPTLAVARDLLGAVLCRKLPSGKLVSGLIIETEAYTQDDPACHAARGLTPRCAVMFGPAGHAYVYFVYGMYYCLNVVTEKVGVPGAVLIRAIATEGGNGPGKLCRSWQINTSFNGTSLMLEDSQLWISPGEPIADSAIEITPRVGISQGKDKLWRFIVKGHPGVSLLKLPSFGPKTRPAKRSR